MVGIYQITNKHNNRKYIGKSGNLFNRWDNHISDLINNKHSNKYLQKDFNKYGYNGFSFEILELCTIQEMNNLELEYISELDSSKDYNIIGLRIENKKSEIKMPENDMSEIETYLNQNFKNGEVVTTGKIREMFDLTEGQWKKIKNELNNVESFGTKLRYKKVI